MAVNEGTFFSFLYIFSNVFRPTCCLPLSVSSLSYVFSYIFFCSLSVRVLQSSFLLCYFATFFCLRCSAVALLWSIVSHLNMISLRPMEILLSLFLKWGRNTKSPVLFAVGGNKPILAQVYSQR